MVVRHFAKVKVTSSSLVCRSKDTMVKILILSSLVFVPILSHAANWILPLKGVVDGDTLQTEVKSLPTPLNHVLIRIRGIDTPESNYLAKCEREKYLGLEAKRYLTNLVSQRSKMTITNYKYDKYGGRIVADVRIKGIDIGKKMIELGYARPYNGTGSKSDWCN